ncbi:MAG: methionine adenosyltransferase [Pirellulales bacterium]
MAQITVEQFRQVPVARRRTEHVERKGIGHPDTMCDLIMDSASVALSRVYLEACGRVLHHNLDKSLLVAGQSEPRCGGGRVVQPMRLVFGDRATSRWRDRLFPVGEIVQEAASKWLNQHLRFVDPSVHLVWQNEILPGSPELVDIFARPTLTANDTSAAVGYAPLTETEQLVLAAEHYLNSANFKSRFPAVGEDIKVMAFRCDRHLAMTIAAAFVDRMVTDPSAYFELKQAVRADLHAHLAAQLETLSDIDLAINTLDDPARGEGGMYLTVLGTSAEGADGGQVGRGNRVNGLISLHRPMTTEAAAGKNPVSHVGKIYNQMARQMATRIYSTVAGIEEVNVWLCSQIGRPLADPWSVAVELVAAPDTAAVELQPLVQSVIEAELSATPELVERLVRGELPAA